MAVLVGLMFSLLDNAFFRFMKQYGTPFSLAQSVIRESGFLGTSFANALICLAALMGTIVIFTVIVTVLERRKLI